MGPVVERPSTAAGGSTAPAAKQRAVGSPSILWVTRSHG